jgi:hypothetical protein
MEQKAHTKTIIMPSNGTLSTSKGFDLYTFVLSLATAASVGAFTFAVKVSVDVARIQEWQLQQDKQRDGDKNSMNQIQLDVRDLRDRAIREENYRNQQKSPL